MACGDPWVLDQTIAQRLQDIKSVILQAELASNRPAGDVQLLAVSKKQPVAAIEQAYYAGQRAFGESYVQEALFKIKSLACLPIAWHFIGPIQSNKTKVIAKHFAWVHSVCRQKIVQQLQDARPDHLPALNICLQVNLDEEQSKSGLAADLVAELARFVLQLPRLHLRGLMIIPKPQDDPHQQYLTFLRLAHLLQTLNQQLDINMDTLSMGMSDDMQAAICAGSTIVRIGTAIFGVRSQP